MNALGGFLAPLRGREWQAEARRKAILAGDFLAIGHMTDDDFGAAEGVIERIVRIDAFDLIFSEESRI